MEAPGSQKAIRSANPSPWRKWIGWPLVVVGLVLFLMGNIGARTGIVMLPFDRHHVMEQFGGGILAAIGLLLATSTQGKSQSRS